MLKLIISRFLWDFFRFSTHRRSGLFVDWMRSHWVSCDNVRRFMLFLIRNIWIWIPLWAKQSFLRINLHIWPSFCVKPWILSRLMDTLYLSFLSLILLLYLFYIFSDLDFYCFVFCQSFNETLYITRLLCFY